MMDFGDIKITTLDNVTMKLHSPLLYFRYNLFRSSQNLAESKLSSIDSKDLLEVLEFLYCGLMPRESLKGVFSDIGLEFPKKDTFRSIYLTDMKRLYTSMRSADFSIKFQGIPYQAHKFMLSANIGFFRALFASGFSDESNSINDQYATNHKQIENMLSYIYTGEIKADSLDDCFQFLYICKKYEVLTPSPREPETYISSLIASKFLSNISEAIIKAKSYEYLTLFDILTACTQT